LPRTSATKEEPSASSIRPWSILPKAVAYASVTSSCAAPIRPSQSATTIPRIYNQEAVWHIHGRFAAQNAGLPTDCAGALFALRAPPSKAAAMESAGGLLRPTGYGGRLDR
jgi:hypothetical protein